MAQKLFGVEISTAIVKKFKDDPEIVTAMIGDISHLPAPERLTDFVPAMLVSPQSVKLKAADGGSQPKIYEQFWPFLLYYVFKYDPQNDNLAEMMIQRAQTKAKILMDDLTLGNLDIPGGGIVLGALVHEIEFSSPITDFYSSLNIPLACAVIHYTVGFRNYNV